jgi:rod shape-determining protein MreC
VEEFFGRYRNLSVLLAVVLAQIILLGYQVRTEQGSTLLQEWTVRGVTPVTKGIRGVTGWFGSSWDNYFWLIGTKQDNDELRRQVERLKLENTGLRSTLARFGREERLIAYQQEMISQTVLAQVIGRGANSNSKEIFISTGLDDGVTAGMPVMTPDGIVGKVQASYPGAALVMLITDPEAGVGVLMARSRAGGILKGTGRAQCRVEYVSHEVDVAMGETVFTSGNDRVFPKGLRIGEVVKLDRGTDFQEIQIKPFAALDRLEEVLVITSGVHRDLPESPQAQPPPFLMPLPDETDPLRKPETPSEQITQAPAVPANPLKLEQNGRVTDADRLRQYYQAITEKQGHRIGHGAPGTPAPEFNAERLAARTSGTRAGGAAAPKPAAPQPGTASPSPQQPAPGTAPQQAEPQQTAPQQATPQEAAPEQATPERSTAPRTTPQGAPAAPPETVLADTVSPVSAPAATTTTNAAPADTSRADTAPAGTAPALSVSDPGPATRTPSAPPAGTAGSERSSARPAAGADSEPAAQNPAPNAARP